MARNQKKYIIRRTRSVKKKSEDGSTSLVPVIDYLIREPIFASSYDSDYKNNVGGTWSEDLSRKTVIYDDFERARDVTGWLKIVTGDILYDVLQLVAERIETEVKDPE